MEAIRGALASFSNREVAVIMPPLLEAGMAFWLVESFTHYYANQKKVTSQSEHKELLKRKSEEASLKVGANRSEIRLLDERIDFMKSSIQQAQTDKKRLMEKEKELQAELKAAQKTYESFKVGEGGH